MEGLSLEYRDLESTTEICRRKNGPQATENTISQKLELLQELLKQKKDLTNRKHRCLPKTQSLDQTTNCFHQETLQKATHLRQRKISTQLKMDTLQKKLQDDKKWEPKSIYKIPQIQQHFQDQLVELNRTLQEIDSDLGKAEHELGESFRELNIVSNTHVKKHTSRNSPFRRDQPEIYQEKLPKIRISKSVDDCRDVSLKTKATKLISSPKLRKLKDDSAKTGSPMSSSWVAKTFSKEEDCDFMADRKQSQLSLSPHTIKLRKSPLCVLGNFMEAQIRERIMLHRRNKSAEHNVEAAKKDYAHFRRRSTSNENIVFRSRNSAASRSAGKLGEDAQPAEKDKCQIRDEHNNTCYPKNIENEGYTKVKTVIKPEVLAEIKAFEQLTQDYFLRKERRQDFF